MRKGKKKNEAKGRERERGVKKCKENKGLGKRLLNDFNNQNEGLF